ncbi:MULTISPECIES: lytic transglycosylase domain-containing protein [Bacteroides]|uniref:Transglycosylase SLT domain-containing protein n=2 Tax=Bacteroidaceae TaxID=815 RepID=A0ABT7VF70_9BACE|nr:MULTISPECIES: lytic transglycosylase domain-containing protein [Bacteroides]MBU3857430.1 transglycosylase SLT domain-containing protein [Candidatus Phocaeicola excrementipullorum]MBW9200235.1 LysM peptidoglycan-binding domain-containing protein [Bacteroidales bacterium SW299]MCR8918593.1 transglycosylase SLT domain-containing protein [Bacteroides sp. ET225]MDM8208811.1 transglycosylase SLT domain-containing protein [Bacteroides gallinaceum]MDM8324951.1 transglycosylase SLT domain-containing
MKKLLFSLFTCTTLSISLLSGQETEKSIVISAADGQKEEIDLPQGMISTTDSLYLDWISKHYINPNENCTMRTENPPVSDSIYMDRLKRIPAIIEMPYNEIVRKFIDMYATRLRQKVAFMLSANNFYMPIFEEALDLYDLPLELKYLPVIESALNPMATSTQGATGLWQFMLRTGQVYGLKVNSLVDERRDPIKSTRAAARYLKDLYDIYQDWNLVLAAYNCGPGTINKAIRRAGGDKDFWEIYNYLPKETRGYVPAFIAANYIMTYYCEHYISPMEMRMPESTDTIHVSRPLNLNQVADVCKINIDELRALNPEFKKDLIPGNEKPYALRLPTNMVSTFIDKEDSIYAYKADTYLTRRSTVAVKNATGTSKGKAVYHRIRNGETLGGIAARYGVSINQLRRLNGIKGSNIRAGKSLRIR